MIAPLPQAARVLKVSVPTLRRWLREGAPQVRRGRRGRGGDTLVDVQAIAAWRACRHAPVDHAALRVFAAELPELVAHAISGAFERMDGLPKARMAGAMAGVWYAVTAALLDHLRTSAPTIPELATVPASMDRLRQIAHG